MGVRWTELALVFLLLNISIVKSDDTYTFDNINSDESDVNDGTDAGEDAIQNMDKGVTTTEYITTAQEDTSINYDVNTEDVTTIEPTDETTLSSIDNNVYTPTTETLEDIYAVNKNNVDDTKELETSTTMSTTKSPELEKTGLEIPELQDDVEGSARNPKTDNTETKQPGKRNFDTKLRPPVPVTKSSTLKGWLEDTWLRPPAGILVPLRPLALRRALAVWKDLTAGGLNMTDIVIVGFDSNGVNWRSTHSLHPGARGSGAVSEALSRLLLKYQGVHTDTTGDGTMRALTKAAKLVPYDSALFVVTDRGPGDPQGLPLALRALIEKRLKVYTIWTDPNHPSEESEEALQDLKNISMHTEGDVLPYSLQVVELDETGNMDSDQIWVGKQSRQGRGHFQYGFEDFDTLLVQRGGGKAMSLGVSLENGVTALRIYIEGAVEHAVLYPPNEAPQIDLYNTTSVLAFSSASRTINLSPRDIYLVFPGNEQDQDRLLVLPPQNLEKSTDQTMVGHWHLSVICDTADCRVCVYGRTRIHFDVETQTANTLKLSVTGPLMSIRETLLVDEYGTELARLPFNHTRDIKTEQRDPIVELAADVPMPTVNGSRVYVKVLGRDLMEQSFTRFSGPINQPEIRLGRSASIIFPDAVNDLEQAEEANIRAYSNRILQMQQNETAQPFGRVSQLTNQRGGLVTTVQIGLSTRLYGSPGDNLQLHFEVTNYREQSETFSFGAEGQLRFLTGINPRSQTIPAGQTINVIVSATIPSNAQAGQRDFVTFTAYGVERVSISAYVYVTAPGVGENDIWPPEVSHYFQGTCIGKTGSDCAQHVWSASIIARDSLGGLLRLSSSPLGLMYEEGFVSGTRDQVVATYRATCCAPRILVSAVDIYGNTNSYIVDISNHLTAAGIAAVVLGVFLAIAIIGLIVFSIYWCVKKRKESRELPSYSTRNVS